MQRIDLRGNSALAFITGLVYGYRGSEVDLKILPFEEFSPENHIADRVYFINRREGKVCDKLDEGVSHVCVVREDRTSAKVRVFIYKKLS